MLEFSAASWFADTARGKLCVLVTSGGRFNIRRRPLALAGPPISAKNRGFALIRDRVLNQANTVSIFELLVDTGTFNLKSICLW